MNIQDYIKNPNKYESFKTAKMNCNVFTHNGENDLKENQCVAVKFSCNAWNQLYKRYEPVYEINNSSIFVYGAGLKDFVL